MGRPEGAALSRTDTQPLLKVSPGRIVGHNLTLVVQKSSLYVLESGMSGRYERSEARVFYTFASERGCAMTKRRGQEWE
jgi:hypothetical protein